jgi:hypothetical protein
LQPAAPKTFNQPYPELAISRRTGVPSAATAADRFHPRIAGARLEEALADSPVVLVHGPRQCGKTTLARTFGEPRGYRYFSFDDEVALAAARADPAGFVSELPERSILDEVQRAPELFPALKWAIERRRTPGRFLLTGSTNVLLVPALSESLAGRMEILRLHLLAQGELLGRRSRFLAALFAGRIKTRHAAAPPGTETTSRRWCSATCARSRASARSTGSS